MSAVEPTADRLSVRERGARSRGKKERPSDRIPAESPVDPDTRKKKRKHNQTEKKRRTRLNAHFLALDEACLRAQPSLAAVRRDRNSVIASAAAIIDELRKRLEAAGAPPIIEGSLPVPASLARYHNGSDDESDSDSDSRKPARLNFKQVSVDMVSPSGSNASVGSQKSKKVKTEPKAEHATAASVLRKESQTIVRADSQTIPSCIGDLKTQFHDFAPLRAVESATPSIASTSELSDCRSMNQYTVNSCDSIQITTDPAVSASPFALPHTNWVVPASTPSASAHFDSSASPITLSYPASSSFQPPQAPFHQSIPFPSQSFNVPSNMPVNRPLSASQCYPPLPSLSPASQPLHAPDTTVELNFASGHGQYPLPSPSMQLQQVPGGGAAITMFQQVMSTSFPANMAPAAVKMPSDSYDFFDAFSPDTPSILLRFAMNNQYQIVASDAATRYSLKLPPSQLGGGPLILQIIHGDDSMRVTSTLAALASGWTHSACLSAVGLINLEGHPIVSTPRAVPEMDFGKTRSPNRTSVNMIVVRCAAGFLVVAALS